MNRKDLEVYVARLRKEFAVAYEAERAAAVHAVTLMRRLDLAEALLDTGSAPLNEPPKNGNAVAPAPERGSGVAGVSCTQPGCTFIASNSAGLAIHQGRMHKAVPRAAISNIGGGDPTANVRQPVRQSAPEPKPPAPVERMEWDLPKRRQASDPAPELPRRAMPRSHGGRDLVAL